MIGTHVISATVEMAGALSDEMARDACGRLRGILDARGATDFEFLGAVLVRQARIQEDPSTGAMSRGQQKILFKAVGRIG